MSPQKRRSNRVHQAPYRDRRSTQTTLPWASSVPDVNTIETPPEGIIHMESTNS
jgi:hypothetical protein